MTSRGPGSADDEDQRVREACGVGVDLQVACREGAPLDGERSRHRALRHRVPPPAPDTEPPGRVEPSLPGDAAGVPGAGVPDAAAAAPPAQHRRRERDDRYWELRRELRPGQHVRVPELLRGRDADAGRPRVIRPHRLWGYNPV
ncbi:hypothetical protein T484DRAFT_3595289 [Baffinella frigidus]|nr:hypothetical protein T484DRAFT_3595289 [Cryptophyta sp. CCMP2293]